MEDFVYLIYTHEEYNDILDIHLKRLQKYCPNLLISICSNNIQRIKTDYPDVSFKNMYEYDDTKVYGERLLFVISQMSETFVLFNHEHNILVKEVDPDILPNLVDLMKLSEIDSVRMFASGISHPIFPTEFTLTKNDGCYFYATITTLWKRNIFLKIITTFSHHDFRCFECPAIQAYTSQFQNFYLSSSKDIPLVNEGHVISIYFPVHHVTGSGKWRTNTPTSRMFIEEITKEYTIDLAKRGEL